VTGKGAPSARTRLAIRVHPRARKGAVSGMLEDGTWKVAVTAPPEDGRANAAVVAVLAAALGVKPRQLRVVSGAASRAKTVEVEGLDAAEAARRMRAAVAGNVKGKADDGE
jgi:uncharacterized protein